MFPKIQSLRLLDFKSFRGDSTIGPFEEFTVLVGSNCLGKFHLIEAIEFVLSTDRMTQRPDGDDPVEKPFVEITIRVTSRITVLLKRVIMPDSSGSEEFSINGRIVTKSKYAERLHEMHIQAGVPICYDRHSLCNIFQQSAAACTEMFERVSGSLEFRGESERLAELRAAAVRNRSRIDVMMRRLHQKHFRMRQKEKNYNNLKADFQELQIQIFLLDLIVYQRNMERNQCVLHELDGELLAARTVMAKQQDEFRVKSLILANTSAENSATVGGCLGGQLELMDLCALQKDTIQDIYDFVATKISEATATFNEEAMFKSLDPEVDYEEFIRREKARIAAHQLHSDYTVNSLRHLVNQALTAPPDPRHIYDQLTQWIEKCAQQLQQNSKLFVAQNTRQRERFLDNSSVLRNRSIGGHGVMVPRDSIIASPQNGLESVLRVVRNQFGNTVIVESNEEAVVLQEHAKSLRMYIRIAVVDADSPSRINAPYSSGLQLKDVMKLTESSSEHVSELFKSALSAMTVTETHEEARAIAGNRTTVENAIAADDGTVFEASGIIRSYMETSGEFEVPSRYETLQTYCDFNLPLAAEADGNCAMFPVDEVLLHREAAPTPSMIDEFQTHNDTKANIARFLQTIVALRHILGDSYGDRFDDDAHMTILCGIRDRCQPILAEATLLNDRISAANASHDLKVQIDKLEGELKICSDKVLDTERRMRSENELLAQNKTEFHRILFDSKKSKLKIPLLEGSLNSLTEEQSSVDGIIVDFTKVTMDNLVENIPIQIDAIVEKGNRMQQEIQSLIGVKKARDCYEKLIADFEALEKDHDEADAELERFQHECRLLCKKRGDHFMPFYRHMQNYLPASYVELMRSETAQAVLLSPDHCEHPWLDDILLDVVVPGRAYRPKEQLSEEEVIMVSVATLFTMRSFGKALPFVVLHEVVERLGNASLRQLLVEYLVKRSGDRQVIVVSDHEDVYAKADSVIAVLVVDDCHSRTAKMPDMLEMSDCE